MRAAVVLALAATTLAGPALARDAPPRGAAAPIANSSYVPDDDDGVRKAFAAADAAAKGQAWADAVRALQRAAEGPAGAVVLVSEGRVFEGVRVVAHHRVAGLGAAALEAYQREFGGLAKAALDSAVERFDERALAETADRWLPSAEGRRAAFLLADLGNERGDFDGALGWLERVEDLEAVAGPGLEPEVARWRRARAVRQAVATAAGEAAVPRVRDAVLRGERPAPADLRLRPEPPDWPTSGGSPDRARTPPPLASPLVLAWSRPLRGVTPLDRFDADDEEGRPSPWLPPRAVVGDGRVVVSDGRFLRAFDLATGAPAFAPVRLSEAPPSDREGIEAGPEEPGEESEAARRLWQWIEGHALTLRDGVAFAAVAVEQPDRGAARDAHVRAVRLGPGGGTPLWEAGGEFPLGDEPADPRLHGAPCLYRDTLYVAGVRPTTSADRFEAVLVALDPRTGAKRWTASLGAGSPIRRGRADEVLPGSCAAAHGRVLVVTALGLAASVDATTGRTLWTYRYDRGSPDGEAVSRRLGEDTDESARRSSFANEPPLLQGGRGFFTPTDARHLFCTFDRPRGPRRLLTAWTRSRTEGFLNLALEHLAGVTDGRDGVPPTLVGVGQGHRDASELHVCVVGMDPESGEVRWGRALPDGQPEPYGRAAVTSKEVYVPTHGGIAAFRLADGADLPFTGVEALPEEKERERPWGNLVVVPGVGLVAVNADFVALWRSR
jgi:outer membrane protein assembly factor BamB